MRKYDPELEFVAKGYRFVGDLLLLRLVAHFSEEISQDDAPKGFGTLLSMLAGDGLNVKAQTGVSLKESGHTIGIRSNDVQIVAVIRIQPEQEERVEKILKGLGYEEM